LRAQERERARARGDAAQARAREIHEAAQAREPRSRSSKGSGRDECAICLEPITSLNIRTLGCGHTFHETCINKILNSGGPRSHKCPLCRAPFTFRSRR
jgi:hypothetical protein